MALAATGSGSFKAASKAGYLPAIYDALHNAHPHTSLHPHSFGGPTPPGSARYTPNYQAILNADPGYMALKNSLSAQGIADAAARKQAVNQDLIQFGAVPDFAHVAASLGLSPAALKMLEGDINPNTAGLASKNEFSTEKELQRQEDQAMHALRNQLAARGAISSGENAYQTGNQEHAYEGAQQNALLQLLGAITGAQQTYAQNQREEQGQLTQGLAQAEAQNAGLPQYQGVSLTYNPGQGKYVGPSGETYTPTYTGNGWKLVGDGTGISYTLNPDGSLSFG